MTETAEGQIDNDLRFILDTGKHVQGILEAFQSGRIAVDSDLTAALLQARKQLMAVKLDGSAHPDPATKRIAACAQIDRILTDGGPAQAPPASGLSTHRSTPSIPPPVRPEDQCAPQAPNNEPAKSWPATYLDGTPAPPTVPSDVSTILQRPEPADDPWTAQTGARTETGYKRLGSPIYDNHLHEPIPTSQAGRSILLGIGGLLIPFLSLFGLAYGIRSYRRVRKHPGAGSRGMAIAGILVSLITPALMAFAIYSYFLSTSRPLDMAPVRQFVAQQVQSEFQRSSADTPVVHVICPSSEHMRAGTTFECTATATGGNNRTVHVQVREVDDSGGVEITITSVH